MEEKELSKINRILFPTLLAILAVTFFLRHNYKKIKTIHPRSLAEPVQKEIQTDSIIQFDKDGYHYELKPLYNYEVSGLIVSQFNYDAWWQNIRKSDKVFLADLCMIWGDNLKEGLYRTPSARFSQDMRFCFYQGACGDRFYGHQLANSHLIASNKAIIKKIKQLRTADQVLIKGQLVNVCADLTGKGGTYDYKKLRWTTSTTRNDSGAGACEVIHVTDVELLEAGNPFSRFLFAISGLALIILIALNIITMAQNPIEDPQDNPNPAP